MLSKFYKFILIIGIAFTASAYAIPKGPCDQQKDVCCKEAAPGPFAFSYPKDIGLVCPRDCYVQGEFLWMKPTEEGLEYAMLQNGGTSYLFPLEVGKIYGFSSDSDEWDWRPGFRVNVGFCTKKDNWNLDLSWTYLRIKSDSITQSAGSGTLIPLSYPPRASSITVPLISARWSGDFNTMDFCIGKPYNVSRYYISNPMFGIRVAWIDQDLHMRYFHQEQVKRNVFLKNDYWGIGLRGLYKGEFLVRYHFSIYGKAALSVLYGKFDTSQHCDTPDTYREYKTERTFYCVEPNAELALGIKWSKFFHKDQYKVSLNVGYEFHHWWNQNQLRKFLNADPVANDTISRGDLAFNGFSFGLNIDF
jgi:hypothetical protein